MTKYKDLKVEHKRLFSLIAFENVFMYDQQTDIKFRKLAVLEYVRRLADYFEEGPEKPAELAFAVAYPGDRFRCKAAMRAYRYNLKKLIEEYLESLELEEDEDFRREPQEDMRGL